ncbi:GNAT family N-acetyltransferase [Bacillus horti]|uniref:GNAT family acetyltransferase n=1 Tax=Caldalkalibacillus horti TaxID=77523 RepID=A0ABT9VY54_9BACI|nr:GNAT family N-acetyltransferase [Bacillus horti]MDQ0165752.1 putative GNAT family acetyltransferase [Bacillus horti]
MIRKLNQFDHEQVMGYLAKEPSFNLFIIGDIEAFGYESDFQDLWGEFNESGQLIAVMLRLYSSYIVSSTGGLNVNGFAEIINSDEDFYELSGRDVVVEQFENNVINCLGKKTSTYFCELVTEDYVHNRHYEKAALKATLDDIERIVELRLQISTFSNKNSREGLLKMMESGISRTFYLEENGVMIAAASTTAENSQSAMIVGVCTLADYRNNGYASVCMSALCDEVLGEGKTLCLFYEDPAAGRIYKRLGFRDIGKWNIYR